MGVIETATGVGIIVGALTLFCVKIVAQVQSNKFKICKCCGNECVRDVDVPTHEVEIRESVMSPRGRQRPSLITDLS